MRPSGSVTRCVGTIVLCVAVLAGLTACGDPENSNTGAGKKRSLDNTLHRGNGAEPQSLDPHRAEGVPSSHLLRDLYEGLTTETPDGRIIPGVAVSWEISNDGTVYTFHLRNGARWSNGDGLVAADFVAGFQRSVNPETMAGFAQILIPIENAAEIIASKLPPEKLGVTAVSDDTLVIRLTSPTPYFLGLLNHSGTYPIHRASLAAHGDRFTRPGNLVSNGAYFLDEWVVQSHIKLTRNSHYWNDAETAIDEVFFYPTENQTSELERFRSGELDLTYDLPQQRLDWARKNHSDELAISPWLGTYFYGFNVTRAPFLDQPGLRKALSMAVDRERITTHVTAAGEIPAYAWVPPVSGYTPQRPTWADWPPARQIEEAKRLYAEAGYTAQNPLRVELRYNTQENHKRIAVAIAAMWREHLGVETTLANQEWKVFLATRRQKTDTELFRMGWIGDYDDPYAFAELLHSTNGRNDTGYSNMRYDGLLADAAVEPDDDKRFELLAEAERILINDQPIMPIYFYVTKRLVKPYVGGYESNIMDHQYTRHFFIREH